MNAQFSPLKKFVILISFCGIFGTSSLTAQSILIDSIFTIDGEIFPFSPLDTAYGLSISGRVVLNSDTSLVRVILTSDSTDHLMIFETYPYIASEWDFNFVRHSDETRYLDTLIPNSIRIQIIDATFELDTISINEEKPNNPKSLQEQYKAIVEDGKVSTIQNIIQLNDMLWFARRNPISDLSFSDKTGLFGDKYNMCGMDYYVGGVYDPIPGVDSPPDDSPLVDNFDWRSRHGANDPEKTDYYYQPGRSGEGWMTSVKNQDLYQCKNLCYIYGPLAAIEGVANLYFNSELFKDYDLSEQQVLNCDELVADECNGGEPIHVNNYISDNGVVDEICYPRDDEEHKCFLAHHIDLIPPEYQVKINGYYYYDISITSEEIKQTLITKGPLNVRLKLYKDNLNHNMALIGYGRLKVDDIFHIHPDHGNEFITVEEESDYIGQLYWIYKNSWGTEWGSSGYMYHTDSQFHPRGITYYEPPIDDILTEDDTVVLRDEDRDGYWNWGIGPRPSGYEWPEGEDSDDSENRIGPFDGNYYGTPVSPEMLVYKPRFPDHNVVQNGGCLFFQGNNPMTIIIVIGNPGNAQLNLEQDGLYQYAKVDEISDENDAYDITRKPSTTVAMGDTSHLKIVLKAGALLGSVGVFKIHLNDCDKDVLSDFEFALVYEECGYLGTQLPINEYTLWDNYRTCHQDIMINRNGILEITGHVAMAENSSIFVEQGGKLIINGGTITGSCQKLWKGVDVWGDPNQPQLPYNQGMVSITNGGMIEYAEMAIETAKHFPRHDLIPSGGIVTCQDAKFKDNLVDVCLQPYQGIYSGIPQPNLSRFTRTRFETTDELYSEDYLNYIPNLTPDKHMMLNQVNGIQIEGCEFVNSSDVSDTRGIGIQSFEAGYFVKSKCNVPQAPCTELTLSSFETLNYGIRAFNNIGAYTVSVDTAVFLHNHRGLFMSLVEHPTVIRSNFDLSDPGHFWITDPSIVGLYMENFTTGFQVEENQFYGELGQENTVGIHILNSGTEQNELYNNSFTGLGSGVTVVGENRLGDEGVGLCIKCNDFADCITDIYVTPEIGGGGPIITGNTGISIDQGTSGEGNALAAGNTFSEFSEINYNNFNGCRRIYYIFHGFNPIPTLVPEVYGDMVVDGDDDAEYSKSGSCPSNLQIGINEPLEKSNLISASNSISYYYDTLQLLVDGGNTEELNYEVISSLPEEALVIRQSLIDESPFLSDTVMISAINKEDVLPNAIIRDVLVLNPQSPKSNKILNAINGREEPMPEYMIDEIMVGLNTYGALEILEKAMGKHIVKRDISWNRLNLYYKNDTLNSASFDSLISLLNLEERLKVKYNLAFIYLEMDDSVSTLDILDSIPTHFSMSNTESSVHETYLDLFNILLQLNNDTTGFDSLHIQALSEISSNYPNLPGIYASNYLIFDEILYYKEPIYLPNFLKRTQNEDSKTKADVQHDPLNIFPNPAVNYFIIEYDLISHLKKGSLRISDLNGKLISSIPLEYWQNQIIMSVSPYSTGLYVIGLYSGIELISSCKLAIIR